jgi:hypothetical protein
MAISSTAGGGALRSLLGAAAAVCRGEMDSAAWLVGDAEECGLSSAVLSISPVVVKCLLGGADPAMLAGDLGVLSCEFGLACRGRFPSGTAMVGAMCLQAAAGRIDPWRPDLVLDLDLDDPVPVWGAVASTWFATEQLALAYGEPAVAASQRICMSIASRLPG